jgi:hypothetical protein
MPPSTAKIHVHSTKAPPPKPSPRQLALARARHEHAAAGHSTLAAQHRALAKTDKAEGDSAASRDGGGTPLAADRAALAKSDREAAEIHTRMAAEHEKHAQDFLEKAKASA